MKAEGGWAAVRPNTALSLLKAMTSTESALAYGTTTTSRAWALMADAMHAHDALAAVELWHGAAFAKSTRRANLSSPGKTQMASVTGRYGHRRQDDGPRMTSSV